MAPAKTNYDETDVYRKRPSEHSLAAMTDLERTLYAIGDLRADFSKAVSVLRQDIAKLEDSMAESSKTMAILGMQVKQLMTDMAETDATVRVLEAKEVVRAEQEKSRERVEIAAKAPNPWAQAGIQAFVTIAVGVVFAWIYHLIKTAPVVMP